MLGKAVTDCIADDRCQVTGRGWERVKIIATKKQLFT